MIINHNLNSMNAHRNMSFNTAQTGKAMEKLSSGLRINRAGDDAAGLAISEKMRGQIRGLDQATRNSQDGISLIQTAEGALNETHSILQRMRELSVQSATDTNNADDRKEIQKEVQQLKEEIDRISTDTEFNTKKLLNGDLEKAKTAQGTELVSVGLKTGGAAITQANAATTSLQSLQDSNGNSLGLKGGDVIEISGIKNGSPISTSITIGGNVTTSGIGLEATADGQAAFALNVNDTFDFEYDGQTYTATIANTVAAGAGNLAGQATELQNAMRLATGNSDIVVSRSAGAGIADDTFTISSTSGKDVKMTASSNSDFETALVTNATNDTTGVGAGSDVQALLSAVDNMTGGTSSITTEGTIEIVGANGSANALSNIKLSVEGRELFNNKLSSFKETQTAQDNNVDASLSLQIGANENQAVTVDINEMSVKSLALASIDVSTQQGAQTAVTVISEAISKVSTERSKLGSVQNRLEHTINNLSTSAENLQAAESRIRDVDMAKEMMNFTKNNILNQAAQAMMSQANQQPQAVLQLLR